MDEPRLNALGQPVGRGLERWRPPAFPTPQRWVGRYCSLEPLDAGRHGSALFDAFSEDSKGRQRGSLREWTRPLLEAIDGVEPSSATRRPV